MLPTLALSGDLVIQDVFSIRCRDPWKTLERGTLIVFHPPNSPNQKVCKRVFGLPGDTVCVDPTGQIAHSSEHVVVPPGHVWVIGDNAPYARDSRHYGPLHIGLIQSRLIARVWFLNLFRISR